SVELVNINFYSEMLPEISKSESYMEHVTLYLYENNQGKHHYIYNHALPKAQGLDLALDTEEDFHVISKIITLLGSKYSDYDLEDILYVYEQLER
ncbi:MAG: spore coat polysaccharide biosynthesis protein SpsF (cytidylyltransferase family), partial [Flavobacteriales bacterium]